MRGGGTNQRVVIRGRRDAHAGYVTRLAEDARVGIDDLLQLAMRQVADIKRLDGTVCNVGGGLAHSISLRELTTALLGSDATRVRGFSARFTGVVFPGETLRLRGWQEEGRVVGEATVASAGGAPDTAVVTDGQGDTVLYTDVNRDGVADQAVEISVDGHVVVADDAGDGHWTAVQEGHLDESGQITIDEASGGTWLPPADVTPERGADNGGTAGGTAGGTVHDGASHGGTDHVAQPAATGHHRHATEVSDMSGAASDAAWGAAWHAVVDSSSGVVRIDSMTGQWISAN